MMDNNYENDTKIIALCPPNEQQWKEIFELGAGLNNYHWKHYLVLSKLPYAFAICAQNESDDYIGVVLFIQPETVNISYVGNFFVNEQYRNNGIGKRMWNLMMKHTDSSKVVVLNAFEPMMKKYRAGEFPVPGETFIRLHGHITQLRSALNELMDARQEIEHPYQVKDIVSADDTIFANLLSFDKKMGLIDRSTFLKHFLLNADHKKVVVDMNDKVVAFGAVSPMFQENLRKIGPLYAENFAFVSQLLHALVQGISEADFFITIPEESESGRQIIDFLLKDAKCTVGKQLFRSLSRQFDFPIEWSSVFAISCHLGSPLV